jgi:hypothetical protein
MVNRMTRAGTLMVVADIPIRAAAHIIPVHRTPAADIPAVVAAIEVAADS